MLNLPDVTGLHCTDGKKGMRLLSRQVLQLAEACDAWRGSMGGQEAEQAQPQQREGRPGQQADASGAPAQGCAAPFWLLARSGRQFTAHPLSSWGEVSCCLAGWAWPEFEGLQAMRQKHLEQLACCALLNP